MRRVGAVHLAGLFAALLAAATLMLLYSLRSNALLDNNDPVQSGPDAVQGSSNAFALLWLLGFDLSPEVTQQIADEDVTRINAMLSAGTARPASDALQSSAVGRFPRAPELQDGAFVCSSTRGNCLARLRRNPDAARMALSGQQAAIQQLVSLGEYDHYHHPFVDHPDAPALPHGASTLSALLTHVALRYIEGDAYPAMDENCAQIAAWRRIGQAHDNLRLQMIANASVRRHIELHAEMLAELPLQAPLPPACREASRPPQAAELNLCPALTRERNARLLSHQQASDVLRAPWYRRSMMALMHVPALTERWSERVLVAPCAAPGETALWDQALYAAELQAAGRLQCLSAPLSCHYVGAMMADAEGYHLHQRDHAARLRLYALLLAQRDTLGGQPSDSEHGATLHSVLSPRHPQINDQTLSMDLLANPRGKQPVRWTLPAAGAASR